jgi:hypothetical protein
MDVSEMSQTTENIVKCFDQLRGFCREVSNLLATADTLFGEKEWTPVCGTRAVADRSDASYYPNRWIPAAFARLYVNGHRPNILAFVSVLVGGYEDAERVTEALLSAGWCEYTPDCVVSNNWSYWYARWHSWVVNRQDNGELCPHIISKPKQSPNVVRVTTFAYPLDTVTSGPVLQEKIVDRLLAEIAKGVSPAEGQPA